MLAILHYFLGFHLLIINCFQLRNHQAYKNKKTYDEMRYTFSYEYDRANPITQNEATLDYLEYIQSKLFNFFKQIFLYIIYLNLRKNFINKFYIKIFQNI